MKRKKYSLLLPLLVTFFVCGCGMKGPLYEAEEQPSATQETTSDSTEKSD